MPSREELEKRLLGRGAVLLQDAQVETRHIRDSAITLAKMGFDVATQAELDTHLNDSTDAHDATAVSVDSTNLSGTAIHVQGSLEELDNLLDDHSSRHDAGGADALTIDAAAATGSLRTLGSGSQQAAAGNHTHAGGLTLISGSSGAAPSGAAPTETWLILPSDASANSTTTFATVMTVTSLPAGTWFYEIHFVWQAAATTTGVKFQIDPQGTVTRHRATWFYPSTGTGVGGTTGVSDMTAVTNTGQHVEHMSSRNVGPATLGPIAGVEAADQPQMGFIHGLLVTSTQGDFLVKHASEVAASSQVMADSLLILKRLA